MNRIDATFQKLQEQGRKALIPFVTAGDAGLDTTEQLVLQLEASGADIIELGVPFSDPIAEGPVIQGANLRALQGGVTTDQIFDFVRELRQDVTVPMVFMTYANVVFSYGAEKFISHQHRPALQLKRHPIHNNGICVILQITIQLFVSRFNIFPNLFQCSFSFCRIILAARRKHQRHDHPKVVQHISL